MCDSEVEKALDDLELDRGELFNEEECSENTYRVNGVVYMDGVIRGSEFNTRLGAALRNDSPWIADKDA